MSIYSSSHEGVSEGRKGTWPRAESLRVGRVGSSGDGRKVRAQEVPGKGPARVRAIQRVGTLSDGFDASGPEVSGRPEVPGSDRKFWAFQKLVQASSSFSSMLPSRIV